jgi:hypothetical protein
MSGWSWRSKETFGDKSADSEGGEVEKPAADAKPKAQKKSIWEDDKESWWSEFDDSGSTRVTGFSGGSSTHKAYSYDEAFDDSDSRWYKKNSFRYGGYQDYSPSRLFRNSFSSFRSTYQSADNELKNKAIQALRTLTRNANTVADKSAKITYNVQFGNGASSNGSEDRLGVSTGKQQTHTIFVTPDNLAKAETDDANDAAIDALTGFVLLRVQIAQGVEKNVLDEVNSTAMSAMPVKLAGLMTSGTISKEDGAAAAEEYANDYAAGMLAKSLLTRLARRSVVKDWGGFAPYFVRHAKQFAAVREKLENKDGTASVEMLSAQIAYNFLIDEDQLPIDKPIEDIVTKHLGDELTPEDILPACRNLVTDIRAYLRTEGKPEAGQIEQALNEIFDGLSSDESKSEAEAKSAMENQLDNIADFMDAMFDQAAASENAAEMRASTDAGRAANDKLTAMKFLDKLKDVLENLATSIANSAVPGASKASMLSGSSYSRSMADSQMDHYSARAQELMKEYGVTAEVKSDKNPIDQTSEESVRESILNHSKNIQEFIKQADEAIKAAAKDIRKDVAKELQATKEKLLEMLKKLGATGERAEALAEESRQLAVEHPAADPINTAMRQAVKAAEKQQESLLKRLTETEAALKRVTRIRGQTALQSMYSHARQVANEARAAMRNIAGECTNTESGAMNSFMNHGFDAYSNAKVYADRDGKEFQLDKKWHENGKDAFFRHGAEEQLDFASALLDQAHRELLQLLLKQLTTRKRASSDDDEDEEANELPESLRKMTEEQRKLMDNAANHLGLSASKLLELLKNMRKGKTGNAKAADIGKQIREKLIAPAAELSPVDEQLFGERVKNTVNLLTGNALDQIHDEATHSVEEEFVAYLSHNDAKPIIRVTKQENHLHSSRTIVNGIKKANRGAIERIRDALSFQSNKRSGEVHGLLSGDLDEGSLHKLQYDSEHIWSQKTLTRLPDVAVGILVDQSGSMASGYKIEQAREMCVVLAEAVKQVPGVHLHIYGHTANRGGGSTDLQLFEHYSSTGDSRNADLSQLGAITALSNNYDGYAIKETAKRLALDPAKKKYLFIIADGLPHGTGYSGKEAEKHVKSVCSFVRTKLKISTYAFGVGVNSHGDVAQFTSQYGENNTVFISNVKQALPKIVRFLRHVLQKEKTLVDANTD